MARSIRTAALAAAALLLLTGCAATAAQEPGAAPEASHTMPDGTVMSGAEHEEHGEDHADEHASDANGPSEAAEMVCDGQVEAAVASITQVDDLAEPSSGWSSPTFTCTFDVDGAPLVLTVHDATDVAEGEAHFAAVQEELGAQEIEGLLGLGLPSFSTGEGVVGFLRDGKTLVVDATALPADVGGSARTLDGVAYATASAVLTCWVEHD